MRTTEQINLIKKNQSDPVQLLNAVSTEDIKNLINFYKNDAVTREKNTGPKVCFIKEGQGLIDNILKLLRTQFGNFKVRNAHFFDVTKPHMIHIDDDFEYSNSYKAFTIPLIVEGADCNLAKLIMFNQYYYGGPAKFIKGTNPDWIPVSYNKFITDYTDIENKDDNGIPDDIKKFITHLQPLWTHKLSVHSYFPWTIGSIIAFNALQLHCASNFKEHGISRKLGISIFTTLPEEK